MFRNQKEEPEKGVCSMNSLNGRRHTVQGNQKEKYSLHWMEIKNTGNQECWILYNVSKLCSGAEEGGESLKKQKDKTGLVVCSHPI